ncbi:MAG: hypothetical protein Q4F95_03425 [Oscillospiraceae bacterium]|nr:hypothetical protein [Oscillospiraceae bacterium]
MAKKSALEKIINELCGVSQAKRKIARATGIPTTKAGRKAKAQRTMMKVLLPSSSRKSKSR